MAVLGNNIFISLDGATVIAGTKANDIQTDSEAIPIASATQQQWEEVIAGRKSWNTSVSWLLLTNAALLRLLDTGLMVTVTIMTRDASVKLQGQALITNCHLTLTEGNLAQGSFAMRGSGPLAVVPQS